MERVSVAMTVVTATESQYTGETAGREARLLTMGMSYSGYLGSSGDVVRNDYHAVLFMLLPFCLSYRWPYGWHSQC